MQIQLTGKNLSVGEALRGHVEARLAGDVARFFDGDAVHAHVTVEKQRSHFFSECTLQLPTGMVLQAGGRHVDAHMSFDEAVSHLERQLKRYKNRLKDHQRNRGNGTDNLTEASSYILDTEVDDESADPANPVIIAETSLAVPALTVAEAAMQLDISTTPFILFRNAGNGSINLVFRRDDGHIGWIDPAGSGAPAKQL